MRIIKKYPNRRLYDTETSTYITLAEVKQFVLEYQIFMVQDARSGEDLTRSILLQIILEEESGGVPMFSSDMLANVIRYYGHSMQGLMGNYLERSIHAFTEAQKQFQDQAGKVYGQIPAFTPDAWQTVIQGQGSGLKNMVGDYLKNSASSVIGMQDELRKQASQLFTAFPYGANVTTGPETEQPSAQSEITRAAKSATKVPAKGTKKPRGRA